MTLKSLTNVSSGYSDDLLLRRVSVEAAVNPLNALGSISTLTASVRDRLKELASGSGKLPPVNINVRALDKALDNQNYLKMSKLAVFRPVGLQVRYMELLTILETQQENLLAIEKRIIDPFMLWSAEALTDPTKFKRLNPTSSMTFMDTAGAQKELNGLFNLRDTSDIYTYNCAVAKNGEWRQVISKLQVLVKRQNSLKATHLHKRMDQISDRCDTIVSRIEEAPDVYSPSKGSVNTLAEVTYKMAAEFELYSRHAYLLQNMVTAVSDSVDKLVALGKDSIVSNEGIGRQIGGGILDHYTFKTVRDVLKVGGWTGWDIDRVLSGIDTLESEIISKIELYSKKAGVGNQKIPKEALSSFIAWGGNCGMSPFIVDEKPFKKLLKAIDSGVDVFALEQEPLVDRFIEGFTGKKVKQIFESEVKTYGDLIKFYRRCADRSRTIVKRSVNSDGQLPKAFLGKHFIGINALVELARQVRSVVRRAAS